VAPFHTWVASVSNGMEWNEMKWRAGLMVTHSAQDMFSVHHSRLIVHRRSFSTLLNVPHTHTRAVTTPVPADQNRTNEVGQKHSPRSPPSHAPPTRGPGGWNIYVPMETRRGGTLQRSVNFDLLF